MNTIGERRRAIRLLGIMVAVIATITLLPMLLLYGMDLAAGTIAPDATLALCAAIGLLGIWIALAKPDSVYERRPAIRWVVIATLIIGIGAFANLAWGIMQPRGTGFGIGFLMILAPVGVALHQLIRLLRLRFRAG